MRLISKTNDYYDSLFGYSSGDMNTFVRQGRHYYVKSLNLPHCLSDAGYVTSGFIGFCGQMYPFFKVCAIREEVDFIYSSSDFIEKYPQFVSIEKKRHKVNLYSNRIHVDKVKSWLDKSFVQSGFYISPTDLNSSSFSLRKVFSEEKVAYFSVSKETYRSDYIVEIYPVLKDFKFYRVSDIHQTYQRITYYLNNELVNPDNPYIVPIPDKVKAESKGFDQFSFRKDKQVKSPKKPKESKEPKKNVALAIH